MNYIVICRVIVKIIVKHNSQIDRENMLELMTYLVHYLTGNWRNTDYNWPKLMIFKPVPDKEIAYTA